ncbi:unnamed protein product, partial [Tetraodon nigroviridis]
QGSPAETQTSPRGTSHLSLPLPEAGNGTTHRVRSLCSGYHSPCFRVSSETSLQCATLVNIKK